MEGEAGVRGGAGGRGRGVKWTGDGSEGVLSEREGGDEVGEAALALDKDGRIHAEQVSTIASRGT